MKVGSEYYFYHNDHLGTPQKMTAVNGAVVWSAKYSSFGKATIEIETVENNLRFPGQYEDAETGLHYNWHRYYDTELGRYLRTDPIGLKGGLSLYPYVASNPLNGIDPTGKFLVVDDAVIVTTIILTTVILTGPTIVLNNDDWKETIEQLTQPVEKKEFSFNLWDCYKLCRASYPCNRAKRWGCYQGCTMILIAQIFDSITGMQ